MIHRTTLVVLAACLAACGSNSNGNADDASSRDAGSSDGTSNGTGGDDSTGSSSTSDGGDGSTSNQPPANATVRVHYPEGKKSTEMGLVGEATSLDPKIPKPMTKAGANTWEFALGVIASDVHVTPVFGDKSARGPAYVVHPGQTLDVYPHFFEREGEITTRWPNFKSKVHPEADGGGRPIQVYLPPTYLENTEARFPVVYMTDGQIVFGMTNPSLGTTAAVAVFGDMQVDEIMDAASESGTIAEAIIVGINTPINVDPSDPQHDRALEMTPTQAVDPTGTVKESGKGPEFVAMIVEELKPLVDSELRTRPEREQTFMSGASLGGLMTLYAGNMHGDVLGGVASFSGSVWWDDAYMVKQVQATKLGAKQASKVYADVGDAEIGDNGETFQVDDNKAIFQAYAKIGYVDGQTLKTFVAPGGTHDGNSWTKRVPGAFAFLLGAGR